MSEATATLHIRCHIYRNGETSQEVSRTLVLVSPYPNSMSLVVKQIAEASFSIADELAFSGKVALCSENENNRTK